MPLRPKEKNTEVTTDLLQRIRVASVAGCSCLTKIPELQYHDEHCKYRVLMDAYAEIEALRIIDDQRIERALNPDSDLIELLDALQDVIQQSCHADGGVQPDLVGRMIYDSGAITAYGRAMRLLARYNRFVLTFEASDRYVGGYFTNP